MKMLILPLAAALAVLAVGCSDADDVRSVSATGHDADSAAVEAIAGDKSKVALVLRRAHARGTFDDALAEAMKDSAMAGEIAAMIHADPRFATAATESATTAARAAASTTKRTPVRSTRSTTTTTASKGDALDRTEAEAKRVNERLEQAARVKREAEQAKRTVDDIFGRK